MNEGTVPESSGCNRKVGIGRGGGGGGAQALEDIVVHTVSLLVLFIKKPVGPS